MTAIVVGTRNIVQPPRKDNEISANSSTAKLWTHAASASSEYFETDFLSDLSSVTTAMMTISISSLGAATHLTTDAITSLSQLWPSPFFVKVYIHPKTSGLINDALELSRFNAVSSSNWVKVSADVNVQSEEQKGIKELHNIISVARFISDDEDLSTYSYNALKSFLDSYGLLGIQCFAHIVKNPGKDRDIIAELLNQMGNVDNKFTYKGRVDLLMRMLKHADLRVRAGAISGLSNLCDPNTIPALEQAIESEPSEALQADLNRLLNWLRKNKRVVGT